MPSNFEFQTMKKIYLTILHLLTISLCFAQTKVFINEFHYDNIGLDSNEGVEIAGPSGIDLSNYTITLYNGNGSKKYNTIQLSGTIPTTTSRFGSIFFSIAGIQNGAPDGIALSKSGTLVQFLSYEGIITAVDDVALGQTSTDIGVRESNSSTPVGHSLQLAGTGTTYEDFSWTGPLESSRNTTNLGQTFSNTASVSEHKVLEVKLHPNPTNKGYFKLITQNNEPIQIEIYNTIGQLVWSETTTGSVNTHNLNAGVYIVKLTQNNRSALRKLIIR